MGDHRDYKKRIKSYAVQIKYVDSIFEAEICKPVEQRDESLMNECLDTLDYLHDSKRKLITKLEATCPAYVSTVYKRPRLVFATIITLVILIGTGVAQACGFRIWSALIHWDAGYLHVNYVPAERESFDPANIGNGNSESGIIVTEGEIIEQTDYVSIKEALSDLDVTPMLPTYLPNKFKAQAIQATCQPVSIRLIIDYKDEENQLIYEVVKINEPESASTVALPGDEDTYKTYESSGITYILSQTSTMVYATWTSGNMVYTLDTDLPYMEVLHIIDSLEVYAK